MVFTPWTAEDLQYAWHHAFAYADPFATTDDAAAYANHYEALCRAEEDMSVWPDHGDVFIAWRGDR